MKPLVFESASAKALTQSTQSLGVWLNALAVVQRPMRIVHVGIRDWEGESCVWTKWLLTSALVIDAEPITAEVLNFNPHSEAIIDVRSEVVAEIEGSVAYFVASNPYESGLVDPSLLRMVWPSLTLLHQIQRDAVTLDYIAMNILSESKSASVEPLWLIVDALPAVRILSGGSQLLEASSLVCVRVLAEAGFQGEPAGADLVSVDFFLEDKGFTRVVCLSGLNPKIVNALYVRKEGFDLQTRSEAETLIARLQYSLDDMQALQQSTLDLMLQERNAAQVNADTLVSQIHQQTQEKEAALRDVEEQKKSAESASLYLRQSSDSLHAVNVKLAVTLRERDAARMSVDALGSQLQEQAQAKEQAIYKLAETNKYADELAKSLEYASENLRVLQSKLDVMTQGYKVAQESATALSSQLQEQIRGKELALQQLTDMQRSFDAVTTAHKTQELALELERSNAGQLAAQNQELGHRQQLMNDELVKAEGQISLIKDLLLREQGI